MAEAVAVQLTLVSKIYSSRGGAVTAVDDVSLTCEAGEFVSIVGPSGCGKSTLLLMVAGLLSTTTGEIVVGGLPIEGPYTDIGIVFQDPVLLPWRKVIDNVGIQGELRKLPRREIVSRASGLLRSVGLEGFEHRFPFELSGGMQQRVAICRALLHDPPLLLMDEPFGAIDALTRDQLNLDLQEIWSRSPKTVLFVTHSISEAVLLSDRVVVMSPRPGRIVDVVDIDLPRPRGLRVKTTREFGVYEERIWDVFSSLGVLKGDRITVDRSQQ